MNTQLLWNKTTQENQIWPIVFLVLLWMDQYNVPKGNLNFRILMLKINSKRQRKQSHQLKRNGTVSFTIIILTFSAYLYFV